MTFFRKLVVFLFLLQLIHLAWLSLYLVGVEVNFMPDPLLAAVDYTEIPALLGMTWYYVTHPHDVRQKWLYVILLNLQWIHILWITDEFILRQDHISGWLVWAAALIDYGELPVMIDSFKREARATTM